MCMVAWRGSPPYGHWWGRARATAARARPAAASLPARLPIHSSYQHAGCPQVGARGVARAVAARCHGPHPPARRQGGQEAVLKLHCTVPRLKLYWSRTAAAPLPYRRRMAGSCLEGSWARGALKLTDQSRWMKMGMGGRCGPDLVMSLFTRTLGADADATLIFGPPAPAGAGAVGRCGLCGCSAGRGNVGGTVAGVGVGIDLGNPFHRPATGTAGRHATPCEPLLPLAPRWPKAVACA